MRLIVFCVFVVIISSGVVADQHVTRDEAVDAIEEAESDITSVMDVKNRTMRLNSSLEEARLRLRQATFADWIRNGSTEPAVQEAEDAMEGLDIEQYHYSDVLTHTREVNRLHNQVFNLTDRLRATESRIDTYQQRGLNTSVAETLFGEAKTAYRQEQYDIVDEQLIEANRNLDETRSTRSITDLIATSSRGFVRSHASDLLIGSIIVLMIGAIGGRYYRNRRKNKRIEQLQHRCEALEMMMEETQKEYFVEDAIPKSVYEARMQTYRSHRDAAEQDLSVLTEPDVSDDDARDS